jgi:hypothetical protein
MQLSLGRYQTRNSRVVELFETFQREKPSGQGTTKIVTVWKGRLLTASQNLDSVQEWEETNIPNTLGCFVSAGRVEGVTSEFDLIYKYPAAA